jgi:hypothetical protein
MRKVTIIIENEPINDITGKYDTSVIVKNMRLKFFYSCDRKPKDLNYFSLFQ